MDQGTNKLRKEISLCSSLQYLDEGPVGQNYLLPCFLPTHQPPSPIQIGHTSEGPCRCHCQQHQGSPPAIAMSLTPVISFPIIAAFFSPPTIVHRGKHHVLSRPSRITLHCIALHCVCLPCISHPIFPPKNIGTYNLENPAWVKNEQHTLSSRTLARIESQSCMPTDALNGAAASLP